MTHPDIPVPAEAEGDTERPLEDPVVEPDELDDGGLFDPPDRPQGRLLL